MRKLTYFVAATIDGFIAGPDCGDPSPPKGFFAVTEDYLAELVSDYPETLPGRHARRSASRPKVSASIPSSKGAARTTPGWRPE